MARVLVADDDEDIRDLVVACLESAGHTVTGAFDGRNAWDLLGSAHDTSAATDEEADDDDASRCEVLVVDRMMPGLSGMEVIRRCRADPRLRDLSIIMLTARALPDEIDEGLNEGADRYVTKPFSPRELKATVADLLSSRKNQ